MEDQMIVQLPTGQVVSQPVSQIVAHKDAEIERLRRENTRLREDLRRAHDSADQRRRHDAADTRQGGHR